ncbi:hypothetical protein L914_17049 [Phytophthora nicotianae]|uniref:Uncharacterized protein n=2 Tax=Phytophthora nicotianae TaxID=4792 RepID=V9EAK4_PHYNI|nr:hypothetical protein F443_17714 [Phytophthora nicotianae P1569]ETM36229.1 hypothetical protein L914_17049 [Phytophthora nicotianae]
MAKVKPERAAVVAAIAQRHYPPALKYPERQKDSLLSTWFAYPTLTWAPECLTPTRKPKCIVQECPCEPKVKEYMQRTVEDVEHKTYCIMQELFDIIFDSMLTTKGIAGAVSNINRRRQKRYYRLLASAGVAVEIRRVVEAAYAPPLPPTEEQIWIRTRVWTLKR